MTQLVLQHACDKVSCECPGEQNKNDVGILDHAEKFIFFVNAS